MEVPPLPRKKKRLKAVGAANLKRMTSNSYKLSLLGKDERWTMTNDHYLLYFGVTLWQNEAKKFYAIPVRLIHLEPEVGKIF